MKNKKIIGINTHFLLNTTKEFSSFRQISFEKNISLYDYDTIIIDSKIKFQGKSAERKSYQNGLCLSDETVFQLSTIFDSFRTQLTELLQQGKNIYVIMNLSETYYHLDYQHERYDFDIMSYLPIRVEYEILSGQEFYIENKEPYNSFFSLIKQYISYENIIKCDFLEKLITIKGTDKCIGGVCNIYNGKIIFIPNFSQLQPQPPVLLFSNQANNTTAREERDKIFLKAIQELETKFSTNTDEILPDWTNNFQILNEKKILQNINNINNQIKFLQKELDQKQEELTTVQSYKLLLTSSGKTLENIVKRTLQEIGFSLCETEENRSDIIAKYNDIDIVAEIKGLTKSAGEKNSAQLEKWASEFMENNGREPKSLLIVNGYYELPLEERKEDVFPNQMLKYANKKEQCLLTTYQLLKLFIDIKEQPENSNSLIMELLQTIGIYKKY